MTSGSVVEGVGDVNDDVVSGTPCTAGDGNDRGLAGALDVFKSVSGISGCCCCCCRIRRDRRVLGDTCSDVPELGVLL